MSKWSGIVVFSALVSALVGACDRSESRVSNDAESSTPVRPKAPEARTEEAVTVVLEGRKEDNFVAPRAVARDEGKLAEKKAAREPAMSVPPLSPPPLASAMGDAAGVGGLGSRGMGKGGGAIGYGTGAGSVAYGSAAAPQAMARAKVAALPMAGADPTSGEGYRNFGVNPFTDTATDHLSTFSIDVDTASYTIARRKILEGQLPPKDSVRVEEFVNYFRYDDAGPKDGAPFAVHLEAAPSPFTKGTHLLRVGLQARRVALSERKAAHLTFLVDVSGSMQGPDKLPLAKKALRILVDNLRDGDTVGLVTYAGAVREVLRPTGLEHKAEIHAAIENLTAGGSTAMASGLELAYQNAARTLSSDSISRVIVLSDGDANVGATSHAELLKSIAGHVKEGVTLSVCGFGMGNYKDDLMEQFADKGNGNYAYIDGIMEAKRVFQEQLGGTLEVVAQDTKLQVDFDPSLVKRYRLVGYENRDIADRDFRNDKVDAGEIGSGHSVTAIYEVELANPEAKGPIATVRVRAKKPRGTVADEWAFAFEPARLAPTFAEASADFRFAVSVMGAAEIFRQSRFAADWSLAEVEAIARGAAGSSAERREFVQLLGRSHQVFDRALAAVQ